MFEQFENQTQTQAPDFLKNKFIQVVSRELSAPLNSARWTLEAVMNGEVGSISARQRDFLRLTHEAQMDVIGRIQHLLAAMDIESGQVHVSKDLHSLESLIESVIARWKITCERKAVVCDYQSSWRPLPALNIDREKILGVLDALLGNAVAYTRPEGRVEIRLEEGAGYVRCVVEDTGVGIPEEEQIHVFSRFCRCSNALAMKPEGSGLGLYVARHYVEQHGGGMGFDSSEDEGSTFWFDLPLR